MNEIDTKYQRILHELTIFLKDVTDRDSALAHVCSTLKKEIDHYDWVGFYLVDAHDNQILNLGPFAGATTEHIRIPFGRGICGQAAEKRRTIVVQDVTEESNYLSCSPIVKSELVVPIFKNNDVIGELDIDSHKKAPFTTADQEFAERLCRLLADHLFP